MACIRGEGEEQVMSAKQHPFLVEVATLLNAAVLAFAVGTAGSASAALQDGHGGNIQFDPQTNEYVLKDKGRVAAVEAERSLATAICAKCHEGAIASLKDSVHFSNQGPNPRILFPGGGAHGALDRACGLPGTSALINYNSDINLGECSKCHVGRFLPPMQNAFTSQFMQMGLPDPAGQAQAIVDGGLDCLICHAEKYLAVRDDLSPEQLDTLQIANYAESGTPSPSPEGYARLARDNTDFDHDGWPDALIDSDGDGVPDTPLMVPAGTDADGNPIYQPWPTVAQDRSVEAVLSVGKPRSTTACAAMSMHAPATNVRPCSSTATTSTPQPPAAPSTVPETAVPSATWCSTTTTSSCAGISSAATWLRPIIHRHLPGLQPIRTIRPI
jgi:hypothetical protein